MPCDRYILQLHGDVLQNQCYLEEHNTKLRQLESKHRETDRRLKESTETGVRIEDEVLASLADKYQAEREEMDALRRAIDDIEFLMFEVR